MNKYVLFIFFVLGQLYVRAQKITLQFDAPPSTTPSVSVAKLRYDKAFAYSFTFDDGTEDAYRIGLPLFSGGTIADANDQSTGLFFTDGCGNNIPFRAGIAWNAVNAYGEDVHQGTTSGMMTWTQLDSLYKADWDVLNHGYSHRARWAGTMTDADYDYEITHNRIVTRQKTQKAIDMPFFVVPSGDFLYQDRALLTGQRAVFDQNFPNYDVSFNGVFVNDVPNLTNFKMYRGYLNQIVASTDPKPVNIVAGETLSGEKYKWWTDFTHRIDNLDNTQPFNYTKFRDYMREVAQNYGKNGTDAMWFAPLQTVFEYLQMRQNTQFTTQTIAGNRLDIDFNFANLPTGLRRRTLTLVVNSDVNIRQVFVPAGVRMTFRGTGNRKIINLDFTNLASFNGAVPIELVDFVGKQTENGSAQLTWQTASETDLLQFEVEKSSDGKAFKGIGTIKAKGQPSINALTNYDFLDTHFKDLTYYRLHQKYADGHSDYTKILTVAPPTTRPTVKITPSVSDDFWLVESDSDDLRRAQIQVFESNGRLMLSQKGTEKQINITNLVRGLYFVKVTIGQQFWVRKMVKFE